MIKSPSVPLELLASRQIQPRTTCEAGVPLYLHAFNPEQLGDPAPEEELTAEADFGIEADGFVIGYDEDDDFY